MPISFVTGAITITPQIMEFSITNLENTDPGWKLDSEKNWKSTPNLQITRKDMDVYAKYWIHIPLKFPEHKSSNGWALLKFWNPLIIGTFSNADLELAKYLILMFLQKNEQIAYMYIFCI